MSRHKPVRPVDRKDTPEHRREYAKRSNTPWRLGHINWKGSMARSIASGFKPKGEVK
jgi:hypothetical protein